MSSFERVNYAIRPAKNIERKMMCEAFSRLSAFENIQRYRYIGFGSISFIDFSLFHRILGIENSVSIEKEIKKQDRFEFNRPYKCVRLMLGKSNDVLPELSWDERTIIWLDYDRQITQEELTDIEFVSASAPSGSILIVTVDARDDDPRSGRVSKLSARVGAEKLPEGVTDNRLGGWGTAKYTRRIIDNEIRSAIATRNFTRAGGTHFKYKQIFNFHYADGAKMLTVGGILYDERESELEEQCEFANLPFIKTEEEPCTIEVPVLTIKEIQHLNKQLPCLHPICIDVPAIPFEDVRQYVKIYKYYPAFVDAEIS